MNNPPPFSGMRWFLRGLCMLLLAFAAVPSRVEPAGPPPNREHGRVPQANITPEIRSADWPGWRGPGGIGIRGEATPVLRWSASGGVRWKVRVPGEGHASPIVVGDRVVVSTADEVEGTRTLYCYSLRTGEQMWQAVLHQGAFMSKHAKNSHASPTPVSDGTHVFVPYIAGDSLWLSAVDLRDGRIAWQPRIGPFVSEWGYASSPALYKDLVIVAGDNKGASYGADEAPTSYLAALHAKTGAVAWLVPRPLAPSYGTPVVSRLAGRDQLLLSGAERIVSFDPATGKELWSCRWSGYRSASAVVHGDGRVYASTNWPGEEIVCVRADGNGDVSDSHVVWRHDHGASDVSSPLYHKGLLYQITDGGIASCRDGATGEVQWQQRLGRACSASAVAAGDRILAADERGTTHIVQVGRQFKLLARNSLPEPILASPALAGDLVLLRSRNFLWCIDGQTIATVEASGRAMRESARPRDRPARSIPTAGSPQTIGNRRPADATRTDGTNPAYMVSILAGLQLFLLLLVGGAILLVHKIRTVAASADGSVVTVDQQPQPVSMGIVFICPGCERKLRATPSMVGKKIRCPRCGSIVPVPGNSAQC
jgi:outer membrane protein assembly factor BamB